MQIKGKKALEEYLELSAELCDLSFENDDLI